MIECTNYVESPNLIKYNTDAQCAHALYIMHADIHRCRYTQL